MNKKTQLIQAEVNAELLNRVERRIDGIEFRDLGHVIDIALKHWIEPHEHMDALNASMEKEPFES